MDIATTAAAALAANRALASQQVSIAAVKQQQAAAAGILEMLAETAAHADSAVAGGHLVDIAA
jgi:hypothetical protein